MRFASVLTTMFCIVFAASSAEVEFSWTDTQPSAGKTSYYYVRGEQAEGELVWVSPMWIQYQPLTEERI